MISGASSGLGKAFLFQLVKEPAYFGPELAITEFWLIASRQEGLDSLQAELASLPEFSQFGFRFLRYDLSDDYSLSALCAEIASIQGEIVCLINSAGLGRSGAFTALPVAEHERVVAVNDMALMRLSYAALPLMPRGARLIQVASSAAFAPLPHNAIYSASKAFVLTFARALRNEVKDQGIVVTTLCPGAIATPFFDKAGEYFKVESMSKRHMMSAPEAVARHGLRAARRGRIVAVYSLPIKLTHVLCKLFPHRLVSWVWEKSFSKD